jgi:hypothetical protein
VAQKSSVENQCPGELLETFLRVVRMEQIYLAQRKADEGIFGRVQTS